MVSSYNRSMKNNNTTEYKVIVRVSGQTVSYKEYLENIDMSEDGSVSRFVRGSGIPESFFEDDEELYSRELYVTGNLVEIDADEQDRFPSQTEPALWFETIEDFDSETNFKSCIPVIDHRNKTITFNFR